MSEPSNLVSLSEPKPNRPPAIGERLRITLISPRGPLYRSRGGIWKKTMRYAPLTLTTLASSIEFTPIWLASAPLPGPLHAPMN
jgi:hypothetical protein